MKRAAIGVFLIVWISLAYFWHARDWNTASRLMLTYSLVDRGSIRLDGLDDQTGDKAFYNGHFYSDKLPGYSFFAAAAYAQIKLIFQFPPHPIDAEGFAYWPADYAVTLVTSGFLTPLTAALLVVLCGRLGCTPRIAAMLGLAYGLGTPAFVYGALAYGHQAASACLLGSFALLWARGEKTRNWSLILAGFLASYASVIELQVGPVSAILGIYAIVLVLRRKLPAVGLLWFAIGAAVPTLFLLAYNMIAFGSPLRMGYFFHATQRFAQVHNASNPLGLGAPDLSRVADLTIKPARGLFWYAPITLLTIPGLIALFIKRRFDVAIVSAAIIAAVFVVNLSYPEWSGGWSTGPRLLLPLLPFSMLAAAGLLAPRPKAVRWLGASLAVLGAVIMLLFAGTGGRIPDPQPVPPGAVDRLSNPIWNAVIPVWSGDRLPSWAFGRRFTHTLVWRIAPGWVEGLPADRQWIQFLPLVAFQLVATTALLVIARPTILKPPTNPADSPGSSQAASPAPAKPGPG